MLKEIALAFSDEMHPVSLKNFLKQGRAWQKEYLEKFPDSSHRRHFKEQEPAQAAPKSSMPARVDRSKNIHVINDIRSLNRETAGVINHHSIEAVERVTDKDLQTAANKIDENRHDIVQAISQQAQAYPVLYKNGLAAIEKMMHRAPAQAIRDGEIYDGEYEEVKDEPISETEKKAAKRVLQQAATFALLSTGIVLIASGAAPLAAVVGHVMISAWGHQNKGAFTKHRDEKERRMKDAQARAEREEKMAAERKALRKKQEKLWLRNKVEGTDPESTRKEPRITKQSNSKELAVASEHIFIDEHADTLHNMLDQMVDVFQYYSADDFKEGVRGMIPQTATASASITPFSNFVKQAGFSVDRREKFYDVRGKTNDDVMLHFERAFAGNVDASVIDDVVTHHFACDDFFATACVLEDRVRFMVDED